MSRRRVREVLSFEDLQKDIDPKEASDWDRFSEKFEDLAAFEALKRRRGLRLKRMFGGLSLYIGKRIYLVFMSGSSDDRQWKGKSYEFPLWQGLLIATDKKRHAKLQDHLKKAISHPVLPKWLFLSRHERGYQKSLQKVGSLIEKGSPLIGVLPKSAKPPSEKSKKIPNIGPKTRVSLEAVGIKTYGDLKKQGWQRVWKKLYQRSKAHRNLNLGRSLFAAIKAKSWKDLNARELSEIRKFQDTKLI